MTEQQAPERKPCGGCGETQPSRRCIGCLHDFGDGNFYEATPPDDRDATIALMIHELQERAEKAEAERDAARAAGFAEGVEAAANLAANRGFQTVAQEIRTLAPQPEADPLREAAKDFFAALDDNEPDQGWVATAIDNLRRALTGGQQ